MQSIHLLTACPHPSLTQPFTHQTGYPVRVHKTRAVVRLMFFNPDDVRWFKPLELWTKSGRRGRITEPLGTHGAFKARFDGPISQVVGVCVCLVCFVACHVAGAACLFAPESGLVLDTLSFHVSDLLHFVPHYSTLPHFPAEGCCVHQPVQEGVPQVAGGCCGCSGSVAAAGPRRCGSSSCWGRR